MRTFEEHSETIRAVAFSPDGKHVLSGSWDKTIKLWHVATGRLIRTFEGHSGSVYSVVFSPNGATVASASDDGTIRLWDAATGTLIATLICGNGGEWVIMTPAGFFAASRGDTQALA